MIASEGSAVVHITGQPVAGWATDAVTSAEIEVWLLGQVKTYGLSSAIALTVPGGRFDGGPTVTFTLADFTYPVAVIVATPAATAVTVPVSPDPATLATDGLLLVQ